MFGVLGFISVLPQDMNVVLNFPEGKT